MDDRFDELIGPRKARLLRVELRRLFPSRGLIPPGCVYVCAEPEFVGRLPVRCDVEVRSTSQPDVDIRAEFQRLVDRLDLRELLMETFDPVFLPMEPRKPDPV